MLGVPRDVITAPCISQYDTTVNLTGPHLMHLRIPRTKTSGALVEDKKELGMSDPLAQPELHHQHTEHN